MSDDLEGKRRIETSEEFETHLEQGEKNFSNCAFIFPFMSIHSEFLIKALTNKDYRFDGAVFTEDVKFIKLERIYISGITGTKFQKVHIDGPIVLSHMIFKKSVIFDLGEFVGNLHQEMPVKNQKNVRPIGQLHALSCTFHDFEFLSSPLNELRLEGNKFLGKFKVSRSDSQQMSDRLLNRKVERVTIEELRFIGNTVATGQLVRFGYLDVDYFHFENMSNPINSEINIGECNFKNFILRNLRNKGKFRVYRINAKDTEYERFELTDSSLGDSEFQNVNLASYTAVVINDNLLSGLQYTGVKWPDNILVRKMDTDTDRDICAKERDTYRILKNVAQKNNDAPQAIAFYAKEMEAYSRTLSWSWSGPLSWPRERAQMIDKSILLFNKYTNAFGLSWWLPIILILDVGLVLYALLLWSSFCTDNFDKAVGQFFVFLNPTHKTKFICGENWQPFTYFFDFTFRLIEATLIYQTIIAFRKFTRRL